MKDKKTAGSKFSFPTVILIMAVVAVITLILFSPPAAAPESIKHDDFMAMIDRGEISKGSVSVTKEADGYKISGLIAKDGVKEPKQVFYFTYDDEFFAELRAREINFQESPLSANFLEALLSFLPFILITFFLLFMMSRMARGGMMGGGSFLKSKARRFSSGEKVTITFQDVAGVEEAKQSLREVVEFLKSPDKFRAMGAKTPKGVLLIGPPGTGKTLLARAVAGEAGVPFFSISGSEFMEMFVGVGASRVRDLFGEAKKNAPCIIFVDELDAVGRQRGAGLGGGHDEREQTLNQILVEMDGFDEKTNVIVLAATNRPDILDSALIRPGRFDRQAILDKPDFEGRKAILDVHTRGKSIDSDVDLVKIAKQTPGFSGADLANLVNEAAILAVFRNRQTVSHKEMEEAIDLAIAGPERKSRIISERERKICAYHEAGHALVAWVLPGADPLHKITIIPRGLMGGYTRLLPEEDRHIWTASQLRDLMAFALGGLVGEEKSFGEHSSGSQNDLEQVRDIALRMVARYGMAGGGDLPPQAFGKNREMIFLGKEVSESRDYSEETTRKLDQAKNHLIETAYQKARAIIEKYSDKLDEIAEVLMEKETLEGEDLKNIFKDIPQNKWPI